MPAFAGMTRIEKPFMLLKLYRFLTILCEPLVRAYLRVRMSRGREDKERFAERFGYASKPRPRGRVIWCHAASVGEASSLLLLIEKIHGQYPNMSIVLTTGTVTAARMVEKRLPEYALHQYAPVDLVSSVKRFLDTWQPTLAIWIESELWPNMLSALRMRSITAILLNARMSDKSFRNWYRFKGFAQELLSTFRLCLAQTEADKSRFIALGARPVKCVGNLKYVSMPPPFDAEELERLRAETQGRSLWLMASTHPGEEQVALEADRALATKFPRLLTVIAPRHPDRGDEIERLIKSSGLASARRSKGERIMENTQVYLADTMGEMGLFYTLCPVTVLGGSFGGTGGHNPIEPAQLKSAIVFGPSMTNFSEVAREFISDAAAVQVQSAQEIAVTVGRLWQDEVERERMARAAQLLADQKRSILSRIMIEISPLLK
ncbi:MAG: 3-deoxy-D-manno-octulosonic acid transferase [Bdellovibrionales bacterium]